MERKKIAVFTQWYLPGTKAGGPVRSIHSLIHLLKDEFDFFVVTTNCDLGKNEPYPNVAPDTVFAADGISYYYFSPSNYNSTTVLKLLDVINPSLVYLNSFWSFSFSIRFVLMSYSARIKCPVLLAPRGMLSNGARSIKPFKKNSYLFFARFFGLYKSILFHSTQEQETKEISRYFPKSKIFFAPNLNALPVAKNNSTKEINSLKLFYLSRISPVKNLLFGIEVLKNISSQYKIEYAIYGNLEDKEYWQLCENEISKLPGNISVNYKGELPFHQIQPQLMHEQVLFLPTLNENFGHSIVESLLCGCPVIISDQTPWNNLKENEVGFSLPLNDKNSFVKAIEHFARMNPEEFFVVSKKANDYISGKINLAKTKDLYKKMFYGCVKN